AGTGRHGSGISPSAAALVAGLYDGEASTSRYRRRNKPRPGRKAHTQFLHHLTPSVTDPSGPTLVKIAAPAPAHRVVLLALGELPALQADPVIFPARLHGRGRAIFPNPAIAILLEHDHGVIGARRAGRGQAKRQAARGKDQSLHNS